MNAANPNTSTVRERAPRRWPGLSVAALDGFWSWWLHALASWLPIRIRTLFGLAQERVLVQRDADSLRLALARGDDRREIGQLPWSADEAVGEGDPLGTLLAPRVAELPRWLLLPAASGLRRGLVLPGAAAERLRDVVGFEIERQTPFAQGDVYFDARTTARRADGQIEAELVAVPRSALDGEVAALGPLADTLVGADMADGDGRALGVNLLPAAARRRRSDPWAGWNWALAAVAVIATAAGLWQMLDNRTRAADAFETATRARIEQARVVSAEKQQLVDLVEGMRFLQGLRAGRPTQVEILDELTRRLPDSTYLEKLSIEGDQLLLIGLSGEASALVQRLEGSTLWRAPALTGALQPDPRTRKDRFTLTATIAVAPPPQAAGARARRRGAQAAQGDADARSP